MVFPEKVKIPAMLLCLFLALGLTLFPGACSKKSDRKLIIPPGTGTDTGTVTGTGTATGTATGTGTGTEPAPTLVFEGSFDAGSLLFDVCVKDSYAYLVDYGNGLLIVDVSNPQNATLADSYPPVGYAYGLDVKMPYAYMVGNAGLQIIDVSNPQNATLAGSYAPASGSCICVGGSYAYVGESKYTLYTIDISNPATPSCSSTLTTIVCTPQDLLNQGSYLYIVGAG